MTYEHVFDTSGWKLSVGGSYSVIVNGMKFDASKLQQDVWIVDPVYSNSYNYLIRLEIFVKTTIL